LGASPWPKATDDRGSGTLLASFIPTDGRFPSTKSLVTTLDSAQNGGGPRDGSSRGYTEFLVEVASCGCVYCQASCLLARLTCWSCQQGLPCRKKRIRRSSGFTLARTPTRTARASTASRWTPKQAN